MRAIHGFIATVGALLFGINAFAEDSAVSCRAGDRACAAQELRKNPAKSVAFWRDALSKPMDQRIAAGPKELVDLIALDNTVNGFPNKPRASTLSDDFMADVRGAFAALPDIVKRKAAPKLAGVYFVDDIGGTGFSDQIYGPDGKAAAGFIVLDSQVLKVQKANAWATWKENTPFKPDGSFTLEAQIEDAASDDRKQAIQYILLHEMGHVLSIGTDIHPPWNLRPRDVPLTRDYPYFELSWRVSLGEDRYVTRFDADFPQRRNIAYYFGAKLAASDMLATYESLVRTNFPSLYAATHPGDDFAEAFASYVHTVLMGKPFEIRISRDGGVVKRYGSCWEEARCAEKRRILEALLK
jgi:hypothetical protein